jgi:hypothetical protein
VTKILQRLLRLLSVLGATPGLYWLSIAALVVGVVWLQFLPLEVIKYLNSEQGPFEQFSVAFFAAAAFLSIASWWRARSLRWLSAAIIVIYAALRELDFQTMFTYRSVMSLGYYSGSVAPLPEKLLVIFAVAPCLMAIVFLLRQALIACAGSPEVVRTRAPELAMGAWIALLFALSHLSDRTSWFRLRGHSEALIEAILALLVLFLVVEIKPRLTGALGD